MICELLNVACVSEVPLQFLAFRLIISFSSNNFSMAQQFETMDSTIRSTTTMCRAMKASHGDNVSGYISSDQDGIGARSPATYHSKSKDLEKLQITLTSKENKLSQTALKVLISRRDILVLILQSLVFQL